MEKLKHIALRAADGDVGEKLQAVYAIRDVGGKQAEVALLDLLGKVTPRRVGQAVIDCLAQFGGEAVRQRLAGMGTDVSLGAYALNRLEGICSAKDVGVFQSVLIAVRRNADTLPAKNLAAAIHLFGVHAYKPAGSFVQEMAAHSSEVVRMAALLALGRVGTDKAKKRVWGILGDGKANWSLRSRAAHTLGELGGPEDAHRLGNLAQSIRQRVKPDSSEFLLVRDTLAARARILARVAPCAASGPEGRSDDSSARGRGDRDQSDGRRARYPCVCLWRAEGSRPRLGRGQINPDRVAARNPPGGVAQRRQPLRQSLPT